MDLLSDSAPLASELRSWFKRSEPLGIGIIHGEISGNSEAIDVDYGEVWTEFHRRALEAVPKLASAPVIKTPRDDGGYQIYFRLVDPPPGSLKLAMRPNPDEQAKAKWLISIETRGEGGYTVAIGSPPECHLTGRKYELISGGFRSVPVLSADERAELMAIALSFDQRGSDHDTGSAVQHQHRVYRHSNGSNSRRSTGSGWRRSDVSDGAYFSLAQIFPRKIAPSYRKCRPEGRRSIPTSYFGPRASALKTPRVDTRLPER